MWNKRVRVGREITGRPGFSHLVKDKQCKRKYRLLGTLIRAERGKCLRKAPRTGASFYGGPRDPSTPGHVGAWGDLSGRNAFATLKSGPFMGIPPRAWRYLEYRGRVVHAQKLDWGTGGDPIEDDTGSYERGIDVWHETMAPLGMRDNAVIRISPRNCWAH